MNLSELETQCEAFVTGRAAADPAHDISHIKRVVNNARYLTDIEQSNRLITIPAAWLHDCVQVPKNSTERSRVSVLAADQACLFLQSRGFPEALLPAVHHAVAAHSFSAAIPVETVEAGVVQDADRLDALGAIGITRCVLTGGAMGSGIYHPDDPFCQQRPGDDRQWMVDHFFLKLLRLPETMQTRAGRQEAERRVAVMRNYLSELGRETGFEYPDES